MPVNPLVSVIVPAWNAARFLPEAIASIRRQNYQPIQIIVVDDGSTDDTAETIAALGDILYIRQENGGPSAARNTGLARATGEFIAFLDADDRWPEQKLSIQMARLLAEPSLDLVLGRIRYIAMDDGVMPDFAREAPDNSITHVHLGSGLYRRRIFERIGGFEVTLRFCEDMDWFVRAREADARMRILRTVTLNYYLHATNMTRYSAEPDYLVPGVLKRSLDRRRKRGGAAAPLPRWSSYDEWAPGAPPLVSVVIPAFNAGPLVGEAIQSVLDQTWPLTEIVVVDDGSTDETVERVRSFGPRVRLLQQSWSGPGAARNVGAAHATGRYLAFLDADDLWHPDKLARQVAILEQSADCDLVFGMAQLFSARGDEGSPCAGYCPGLVMLRREAFDRVGAFRTDLRVGEFIDWYARAREAGLRSRLEKDVWLRRRIHGNNLGVRARDSRADYARVLKASMDRRRNARAAGAGQ